MNAETERELLREALSTNPGCPPLERLVDAAFAAAPDAAQGELLAHGRTCAACAAELALAGEFAALPRSEQEARDVEWIAARLELAPAGAGVSSVAPLARVLPMRRRRERAKSAGVAPVWTRWAAAALIAVGAGVAVRWNATTLAPPLPDRPDVDVVRSGEVLLESPVGELAAKPARFAWRELPGAASYRFELRDVAGDLLHAADADTAGLELDSRLAAILESHVSYSWLVIARDAAGRELARSAPAIFRYAPEAAAGAR